MTFANSLSNLLWLSLVTLIVAYLLVHLTRRYALRRNLLDMPNSRSSHDVPTPRGGGLGMVVAFYVALFLAFLLEAVEPHLIIALCGGLVVAGAGFVDDRGGLSARLRLVVHFAASLWALYWIGGLNAAVLGGSIVSLFPFGDVIALFGLVWLINLFNFMDGIDGIAAAEAVFVSVALAVYSTTMLISPAASLLLAASALGFLCLNWPPARIFMGDVGSCFLGFAMGVIALNTVARHFVDPLPILICLGLFAVDATWTLLYRVLRGEKVWLAHRSHAYQRAARRFGSHRPVLLAAIGINFLWLLPCAIWASLVGEYGFLIVGLAFAPLIVLALIFKAGKAEDAHD